MEQHATFGIQGLSEQEVLEARARFGRNEIKQTQSTVWTIVKELITEPMILLLLAAASVYFISGQPHDGLFMLAAIVITAGISIYQQARSRHALAALQHLTKPGCHVIRNGKIQRIPTEEIVVGDFIMIEEGESIPADGYIVQSHDFSVNEAILTGESLPVYKQKDSTNNTVYQATTVLSGLAICCVSAIGIQTQLGKIGKSLLSIQKEHTPLQRQINSFVKKMALIGLIIFLLVWGVNFVQSRDILISLLKALTLAMSILPEEIPVAFTTFMALGAWRLSQRGIIVKHVTTVETLGSATVICTDKTGTITENRMALAQLYAVADNSISDTGALSPEAVRVLEIAMWASEPVPFDPMEKALHAAYAQYTDRDERAKFRLVHEYPLSGKPPVMTHVMQAEDGTRIIAVKGAPEALLDRAVFTDQERQHWQQALFTFTQQGYRVLGVGQSKYDALEFPEDQAQLPLTVLGMIAFYDPPKQNMERVFQAFYEAGIDVKIITGDNATTTATIARQVGFRGADQTLDGQQLVELSDDALRERVRSVTIFTRMFPEAKLRILNALKEDGHIVAMTGDGVNDAPALKAAHIGIAMGKKGSETAKEVSSLVLTDDDLARMVDAIAMGRKIYDNLKKAIQYVISIHIPIILTVFLPLVLGWIYPAIFSPVHIIFLELIMGPTCSIIYENEPMEANTMQRKPRPFSATFFNLKELGTSLIQGVAITVGTLFSYQYAVQQGASEDVTRTMVFITLVSANIMLTLVNRSFYYSIFTTWRYKNNLIPLIISITALITVALLVVPQFRNFFNFAILSWPALLISITVGIVSVIWYEVVKAFKR